MPQYHTAAPLLPAEGAMRKGQQMPSWNSKKALGYSTISRAASSTNLDLEQSTVTWRRYLCLRFSWVSLPSESRCLFSAIVPAPVLPCKAKKGAGHPPPRARRRESLTVCCLRTVIIVPRPPRSGQWPQLMQSCRHQASSGGEGTGTRGKNEAAPLRPGEDYAPFSDPPWKYDLVMDSWHTRDVAALSLPTHVVHNPSKNYKSSDVAAVADR